MAKRVEPGPFHRNRQPYAVYNLGRSYVRNPTKSVAGRGPGKSDMKELDDEQRQTLDGIRNAVAEEESKLAAVVSEYNATVKAAYEKIRGLIGGYTRVQGG